MRLILSQLSDSPRGLLSRRSFFIALLVMAISATALNRLVLPVTVHGVISPDVVISQVYGGGRKQWRGVSKRFH